MSKCFLELQGYHSCNHFINDGKRIYRPCNSGLWIDKGVIKRLIYDITLSRPEDYLSVYQSCCNHNCLKCHSWYFTQIPRGRWFSPNDLLGEAIRYQEIVTVWESRERATMWHASDLCSHCGSCIIFNRYGEYCPRKLKKAQVLLSPQGYGPARNIISFTGGDLYCRPEYYIKTFKLIKKETDLWIHIETNGYGLIPNNLEALYSAGLDSIWLDMKAYDKNVYKELCGTYNSWILELPQKIIDMDIILEIVLIYIPNFVDQKEMDKFGKLLSDINRDIPITLLAFFPEYMMRGFRTPSYEEMINAYRILEEYGLRNIRLGNIHIFCKTDAEIKKLINEIGRDKIGF